MLVEEERICKYYFQYSHGVADVTRDRICNGALVLPLRHRLVRQLRLLDTCCTVLDASFSWCRDDFALICCTMRWILATINFIKIFYPKRRITTSKSQIWCAAVCVCVCAPPLDANDEPYAVRFKNWRTAWTTSRNWLERTSVATVKRALEKGANLMPPRYSSL